MDDIKLIKHSDLPDHCVDHMQYLEEEIFKVILPLVKNQRMDVVVAVLIAVTSEFLVGSCYNHPEFIEEHKREFIACFANHIDCDIETMKIKIEQNRANNGIS